VREAVGSALEPREVVGATEPAGPD
jgi:hypothetical protein